MPLMTIAELSELASAAFPDLDMRQSFRFEDVQPESLRMRREVEKRHTRPGGTILGPVLLELVDAAAYFCVIAPTGLDMRVFTTSLTVHFLRRPKVAALIAQARIIKRGRRLSVVEVTVYTEGAEEPVAHATCTYTMGG